MKVNMPQTIYADYAATSPLDPDALNAMMPFLTSSFANPSQPYAMGRLARKAIDNARQTIAQCIGAQPDEIFFTSGGSESNNWILKSAAARHRHILTSSIEHASILATCAGLPHDILPVSTNGVIALDDLKHALENAQKSHGKLILSVMMANNETGVIQPTEILAKIAHEYGATFHSDAVQALGHIPINTENLDIDAMSASAHKFNGPKGIGFAFVRKDLDMPPLIDGGSQERRKRAGTENVAAIVGMAAALKKNCDNIESHANHLRALETILLSQLAKNNTDFKINGAANRLPGLLSLAFANAPGESLMHQLDLMGVCIATGSACNSSETHTSHVLRAMRLDENRARATVRISLGYLNTEHEAYQIANALSKAVHFCQKAITGNP